MIFPQVMPVRLIIKGKVCASLMDIDGPHPKPWISFCIEIKAKSRVTDNIDDFYLELRPKSKCSVNIHPSILKNNQMVKGTRLAKEQVIGPYMACFEIDQRQLGISGIDGTREILENFTPYLILRIGFRNWWCIKKKLHYDFQR